MKMLVRAALWLSTASACVLAIATPVGAQQRLVTPDPGIIGLPGPLAFTGKEWMNFRQDREGVTAPVAIVIGQAIAASPTLSAQISALSGSGGGGSLNIASYPAVSSVDGSEASPCLKASVLSKCTSAQQSAYTLGTAVPALPAASALTGIETSNAVQGGVAVKVTSNQLAQGSRILGDAVDRPLTNPSFSATGSGNLTGTYAWTVTYLTAQGETIPYYQTFVSAVAFSGQQGALASIPTGPTGVIGRCIYRTKANPDTTQRDFYLVACINDNTTTTYTDNLADSGLGKAASWAPTDRGYVNDGLSNVMRIGDQHLLIGNGTGSACAAMNPGYASVMIGPFAGCANTTGRRSTGVGEFALTAQTSGYENAAVGTHALQNLTTQNGNSIFGVYAGYNIGLGSGAGSGNAGLGNSACRGSATLGLGSFNTCAGFSSLLNPSAAVAYVTALGAFAGQFADASRQLYIDGAGGDRTTLAQTKDAGLIFCQASATATAQTCNLNSAVRLGPGGNTVAGLPACAAGTGGRRSFVSDGSVAYTSGNLGSTVAGGGSNTVPVFCTATSGAAGNWVIG